jgi:hypothetical protein
MEFAIRSIYELTVTVAMSSFLPILKKCGAELPTGMYAAARALES